MLSEKIIVHSRNLGSLYVSSVLGWQNCETPEFWAILQPLIVLSGQFFAHPRSRQHHGFLPVVLVLLGQIVKVASIIVAPPVLMASLGAGKKASWRITDLPEVIFLLCQRGNL